MVLKMKNILIILYIIVVDQATKFIAVMRMNWRANSGISFGLFPRFPLWVFFVLIFVMLIFRKQHKTKLNVGWAIFIAGMIGNLIDRVLLSYVIDWISFPFPFIGRLYVNLADVALIIGFICIIISEE